MSVTPIVRKMIQLPVPLHHQYDEFAAAHPDECRRGFSAFVVRLLEEALDGHRNPER